MSLNLHFSCCFIKILDSFHSSPYWRSNDFMWSEFKEKHEWESLVCGVSFHWERQCLRIIHWFALVICALEGQSIVDHPKEETQMTNEYLGNVRCLPSGKCKWKLWRFRLTPVSIIKKAAHVDKGVGKGQLWYTAGGSRNSGSHCWNQFGSYSKKLKEKNCATHRNPSQHNTEMHAHLCLLLHSSQ